MTNRNPSKSRTIDTSTAIPRENSDYMDSILGHTFPVLDHGFIKVLSYMNDDAAICRAARLSYQKGTKTIRDDEKLIRYLFSHEHTSPFEQCEIQIAARIPTFVARQWVRTRTAQLNELSARYSVLPREFYVPDLEHVAPQSKSNKQGREDDGSYPEETRAKIQDIITTASTDSFEYYDDLLEEHDLARELSRMVLPLNTYTEWVWKINLHNLLRFLGQRTDPHAQYEVRAYANVLEEIVKGWVPATYQAWVDYKKEAISLSRMEKVIVQRLLKRHLPDHFSLCPEDFPSDMSQREIKDFAAKFPGIVLRDFG